MADKISDLSGEAREKRIAELKKKMQESARNRQTAAEQTEAEAKAEPEPEPSPAPAAEVAPTAPPPTETGVAPAEPIEQPVEVQAEPVLATQTEQPSAVSAPKRQRPSQAPPPSPEITKTEMNRREFLTYAWGGALGLLALQGAGLSFVYMYPRFKEGEFGGKFFLGPESSMPQPNADPLAYTDGKFWLVTTDEQEVKALYMVCTHLGCLYKWEDSNGRFECPCHGSKFTHDGHYIEGPAPRSLDYFDTETVDGVVVVDTGARNLGAPATESPANINLA